MYQHHLGVFMKFHMSRRIAFAADLPALLTVLFVTAPNVSAAPLVTVSSSTTGSSVSYTTGSHSLVVCDTRADGDSPYAWWNPGTSHHQPTNRAEFHGGNGHCGSFPVTGSGGKVSFQPCP
jgi:hypothetical protein